jgi:sigma-B regulation protein RsbU (phosphoserine phosphatase)
MDRESIWKSGRQLGPLFVLACLGAFCFVTVLDHVSPSASFDLRLSRGEIMDRAEAYLLDLGYDPSSLQQDAWSTFDANTHIYLQVQMGIKAANAALRADSLPAHHWFVHWYDRSVARSQNRERFRLWMTPGGEVMGFEHVIRDSVSLPSLSYDEAQSRAEAFLRAEGIDLAGHYLRTSSDHNQLHRLDYRFVWAERDTAVDSRIWVRVQGDEVGGFRREFEPVGTFQRIFTERNTFWTLVTTASFVSVFLLFFFIVILFLRKYHAGEVGTRTAFMVFLGFFAIGVVQTFNEFSRIGSGVGVGDVNEYNVRLVTFVFSVVIVQLFLAVLVFAAWSVGESSSRTLWPEKLKGADSFLSRKFFTADVGEGILRGYFWGLILLGAYGLLLYGYLEAGLGSVFTRGLDGIPEAFLPPLQPLLYGVGVAGFTEVVFRLFFVSYLREKTGRAWYGLLLAAVVWSFAGLVVWSIPYGSLAGSGTFVVLLAFGIILGGLFLRYDLLTTFTANFVMVSLSAGIPLFVATGEQASLMLTLFIVLLLLPPLVAVGAVLRGKRFEFTPQTLPAHIQRISERVRMAKELEIARSVQMSLLPRMDPRVEGFDIAGVCVPAQEVGGDYFDFISLGGKRLGIAIGDVSGKGVPAAIYMTLTKGILQSHAEETISPKTVLSKVNSLMYRTIERNSFVSMFYAILDVANRTITFARAGQCPLILTQEPGQPGSFLSPPGMALGLEMGKVFDSVLEEQSITLSAGEVLVFYTDGFTEAMNEEEEEFGEERLVASVARHRDEPAATVIRAICDEVSTFAGSRAQHDDMTMVVIKVN